ncbi:rhomboid-domain-containing protein [Tilletiaria anomala UBC 951]|uniref:Rhomboid-type serine protease n=1 Tax=Tilletiaria anomala (strain ATCC 24038 / CBS 436.72 / UBC 951) TaxID=1037660 RepID=A0A066VNQ0_TILAU|nr:rhomboid-domain-containing protein [Tilletiaria anomala UBC 951]KDN43337.1 rhomboid-domain-containing protein [Tilletiaria anomala UBC 951]
MSYYQGANSSAYDHNRTYEPYSHVRSDSNTSILAPYGHGYEKECGQPPSYYRDHNHDGDDSLYEDGQSHSRIHSSTAAAPPPVPSKSDAGSQQAPGVAGGLSLMRSDTLRPADSISQYQYDMEQAHGGDDVPSIPQPYHHHQAQTSIDSSGYPPLQRQGHMHNRQESSASYYDDHASSGQGYAKNYGHAGYEASNPTLPLRGHGGSMGYADDEEDERKQLSRGPQEPILFSNMAAANGNEGTTGNDRLHGDPNDRRYYDYGDAGASAGAYGKNSGGRGFPFSGSNLLGINSYDTGAGAAGPFGYPKGSLQEAIEKRRRGIGRQRFAPVSYLFGLAYLGAFVSELIKSSQVTGSAIQTHPTFNPWIGPSPEFLISFGARFVPCMRSIPAVDPSTAKLPCLQYANADNGGVYMANQLCTLADLCGLADPTKPNQQWRLVVPIFLHGGVVHILFNMLAQIFLCTDTEKLLGSVYYTIVYVLGGIGGNLLGASFGLTGLPAVGASGSIFSCIAVEITDLIYNWKYEMRAKLRLTVAIFFTVFSLGLGLLPYSDNFSHIGGAAVGLLGGFIFGPSIHSTRAHRGIIWGIRIVCLGLLIGFIVGLVLNFESSSDPTKACTWCRYLSCLPTFSQCKDPLNGIQTGSTTSSSSGSSNH